jgi:tight adherence protein B
LPLFYARQRKFKRIRKFEEQFPDALDMLNRALRAGLALNGAIQIVADESPDPVAKEFRVLFEENRLGLDMKEALKKLGGRVDSAELHLFVTAVILQRETGGNLAEILERTAVIIRDRFRILGDIRTLTAQARLSGFILTVLPIVMAAVIYVVAPEYLKGLVADQIGRALIVAAVALQVIGFLVIRRIIDIKV